MLTRFDARIWIFEESRDSLHHFSLLLHFSLNIIVIVVPIFKHPGPIFRIPLDHFTVAFLLWPFHSHDDLQRKIINKWIQNDEYIIKILFILLYTNYESRGGKRCKIFGMLLNVTAPPVTYVAPVMSFKKQLTRNSILISERNTAIFF